MRVNFPAAGQRSIRWALAGALLVIAGGFGCSSGDNLDRQPISGTITLDGTPLATGTIRFDPASAESGTQVAGSIQSGKYSIPRSEGPVPGSYKVQITSVEAPKGFEPPAGKMPGEVIMPKAKELVPDKYNIKSDLTATIKSGQSEAINFTLTSK
jgi:hypothetical protein